MSKTAKTGKKVATSQQASNKKYPTEKLLKSRQLSGYQRDFARAILKGPAYTVSEAKAVLDKALKGN